MKSTPPRSNHSADISIIVHTRTVYKHIHLIGNTLAKRNKLGIHREIENLTLALFSNLIRASYATKEEKKCILETARIEVELLKHLVRTEHELSIIKESTYFSLSEQLVEISKMTNGWIQYLENQKLPFKGQSNDKNF